MLIIILLLLLLQLIWPPSPQHITPSPHDAMPQLTTATPHPSTPQHTTPSPPDAMPQPTTPTPHHTITTAHHCILSVLVHHASTNQRLSLGSCCAANTCSHTFQNLEYPCGDSLLILVIRSHQQMFLRIQNRLLPRETEKRTGESCELLLSAPEISYCRIEVSLNDSLGVMRITVTILGHCFLPQLPSTSTTAAAS